MIRQDGILCVGFGVDF